MSERMIVREPAWRGQRVVSDGEMTGEDKNMEGGLRRWEEVEEGVTGDWRQVRPQLK